MRGGAAPKNGNKRKRGNLIQNFLKDRSQQVLVDGKLSSVFLLLSGIPQGSVLGPILFLIFISDITKNLETDVLIYVDDTKTLKRIRDTQDVVNLQADLDRLHQWGIKNNMKYNGETWKEYQAH